MAKTVNFMWYVFFTTKNFFKIIYDPGLSKELIKKTLKKKIRTLNFFKIKNFCSVKYTVKRKKR